MPWSGVTPYRIKAGKTSAWGFAHALYFGGYLGPGIISLGLEMVKDTAKVIRNVLFDLFSTFFQLLFPVELFN